MCDHVAFVDFLETIYNHYCSGPVQTAGQPVEEGRRTDGWVDGIIADAMQANGQGNEQLQIFQNF